MKILLKLLLFKFILIFSIYTHAGTAQVGSMNGFGSHAKGLSSNNSYDDLINIQRDHELKSKDVFALKSLESINESSHLQIQDLFLKSYKRLIQGMIQNNILSLESLKQVIEGKDYFFFNFFKENLYVNKNIYKNAFSNLYKNIEKLEAGFNIHPYLIEILNNEWSQLEQKEGIRKDSLRETLEVFSPQVIKKIKAYKEKAFKQIRLPNGEGVFVLIQDENTLAVHDSRTGEFLFSKSAHSTLGSSDFNVQYLKNENKTVLYYLDQNKLVVVDLVTKQNIHEAELQEHSYSYSLNPELLEMPNGQTMIILNSVKNAWNKDKKEHVMNFYDYKTGLKIHSTHRVAGDEFYDNRYIIKNNEGKYVIVLVLSNSIYFIDPLTGKEIYYNKKVPFLNIFYQVKVSPLRYSANKSKGVSFIKNDLGEDVLVFEYNDHIYFINPFTGKQIYIQIYSYSLDYFKDSNVFEVDGRKIAIIKYKKENFNVTFDFEFLDIETKQSVFPSIEISGSLNSKPIVYKNNSGDWKLVIRTDHKEYFSVFDLKTGKEEFKNKSAIKISRYNASHFSSRDQMVFLYFPETDNTISFMDIETGNIMDSLSLAEVYIDKVYFFQNAQGIHESGMALGTTNGVSHWYFFNLYSDKNKSEMGSEQ